MPTFTRSPWFFPIVAFLVISVAAVIYGQLDIRYTGWAPASCLPDDCFCEAQGEGAITQPLNTYTNLIYVFFGMLVWGMAPRRDEPTAANPLLRQRIYSLTFACGLVAIGLGSFFYHASLTFVGQWFDLFGMYLLITLILLYNLARLIPFQGRAFALTYIGVNIILGILQIILPQIRREVFAGLLVAALLVEAYLLLVKRPQVKWILFPAAIASMALGYAVWLLDNSAILCDPRSFFQGHAVWHFFTALAPFLLYLYYRSERVK